MGTNTDTGAGRQRKTLEEIRRELDDHAAATGQLPLTSTPPLDDEWSTPREPLALDRVRRRSRFRSAVIMALMVCAATEVLLIAHIVMTRYRRPLALAREVQDQPRDAGPGASSGAVT